MDLGILAEEAKAVKPVFLICTKFCNIGFMLYPSKCSDKPNWKVVRSSLTNKIKFEFGVDVDPDWIKYGESGYTAYDLMDKELTLSQVFNLFRGVRYHGFDIYPYISGHRCFAILNAIEPTK